MLDEFVTVVAENRKLPPETVRALADGRAFTGRQALAAGLIDHLGDAGDALERLAALTGVDSAAALLEAPKPARPWWRELVGVLLDSGARDAVSVPAYRFYF
jgi:protease-4